MAGIVLKSDSRYLEKMARHYEAEARKHRLVPSMALLCRQLAQSYRDEAEGQRMRETGASI